MAHIKAPKELRELETAVFVGRAMSLLGNTMMARPAFL
jgi:hypothetical protein